jgi:hypothetical protein
VHRVLVDFGVTHVLWQPETVHGVESVAGELVFHTYAMKHLVNKKYYGGRILAELPAKAPRNDGHTVFNFGCDAAYASGLFDLADMRLSPLSLPTRPLPKPPRPRVPLDGKTASKLIARASHLVLDPGCPNAPAAPPEFMSVARWGRKLLYVRR